MRGAVILIALVLAASLAVSPALALRDPAAVYCTAMNYTFTIAPAAGGGMADTCMLPDGRKVDAWQFLQGQAAPEYSYCKKAGYEQVVINDSAACAVFGTQSCAACVLPDGSKTEVTKVMNLDFREKLCSNGVCCDPATATDCTFATGLSPDMLLTLAGAAIVLVLAAGLFLYFRFRKKKQEKNK
jgi:LPXTG-motif cell wall-anchored protein